MAGIKDGFKIYLNRFIMMTRKFKTALRLTLDAVRCVGKQKIFCIGINKTGTTSMAKALSELGISIGRQGPAELLIQDWARRDFRRLIRFCYTA
jgi:hypothetical protein